MDNMIQNASNFHDLGLLAWLALACPTLYSL